MISVAANGRCLLRDNQPFFYLADTAWELFHRLNRADTEHYLQDRAAKRFNVIQAVALAEFDGLHTPNAYGQLPLINDDPQQPNETYWHHVDWVIERAAALNLVVGLLPTWGDKVTPMWGVGPAIFTPDNARSYGMFLGRRYRDQPVIWILGGDRPAQHDGQDFRPIWRAMAEGITAGVAGPTIMTYHPRGGASSSAWLHDEAWLDFNMIQSGHGSGRDAATWDMINADYERAPAKPTLDAEPNYEDHPVNPWPKWDPANGYFRDYDVRKQSYRSVFAGGCGVTYGHHAIWQFYAPPHDPISHVDRTWREALGRPGAQQMQHLRALIESRPMLDRVPDQTLPLSDAGQGSEHTRACRATDGSYAFVYSPAGSPFALNLSNLGGARFNVWWFDPRSGEAQANGTIEAAQAATFTPPTSGEDWVLVLDDVRHAWAAPGQSL